MRDILVKVLLGMFSAQTFVLDFQNFVSAIRPTFWQVVPGGATARHVVNLAADLSLNEGWVGTLVAAIPRNPGNAQELVFIESYLAAQPKPTVTDPFEEVLLDGIRPFVNRRDLRASLRILYSPVGSTLLLVNGERESGKTFSALLHV